MARRWTFLCALVVVLGPLSLPAARAGGLTSEDLVYMYLDDDGAQRNTYTVKAVDNTSVSNTFPNVDFFEVTFRQYPVAMIHPQDLSASNLFAVQDGFVWAMTQSSDLVDFFFYELPFVSDDNEAMDAGIAYLRLTEAFIQDMFYAFDDPEVEVVDYDEGVTVTGSVAVSRGGTGSITLTAMDFDTDGLLLDIQQTDNVRIGVRPICQATKLLDPDPIVRGMAEQAILVMGRTAKEYLEEQRAKARPDLQKAIDRMWQRIVDEGR
jgi:hypothetical protein